MVEPVDTLVQMFADAGADLISFHPEATTNVDKTLSLIKDSGCAAGFAVNPAEDLHFVKNYIDLIYYNSLCDFTLKKSKSKGNFNYKLIPYFL